MRLKKTLKIIAFAFGLMSCVQSGSEIGNPADVTDAVPIMKDDSFFISTKEIDLLSRIKPMEISKLRDRSGLTEEENAILDTMLVKSFNYLYIGGHHGR